MLSKLRGFGRYCCPECDLFQAEVVQGCVTLVRFSRQLLGLLAWMLLSVALAGAAPGTRYTFAQTGSADFGFINHSAPTKGPRFQRFHSARS